MAFGRERARTSEGLFPFTRQRVAFPHSLGGHCSEWWPGRGQSHSQPCLGARRAANVAPAVAGDRNPQSPLCCQRHQWALAACTVCSRRWHEPLAMLWLVVLVPANSSAVSATHSSPRAGRWCQNSQREICVTENLNWCYREAREGSLSFLSMYKELPEEWLSWDLRCLGIRTSDSKGNPVLLVVAHPFSSEESQVSWFWEWNDAMSNRL